MDDEIVEQVADPLITYRAEFKHPREDQMPNDGWLVFDSANHKTALRHVTKELPPEYEGLKLWRLATYEPPYQVLINEGQVLTDEQGGDRLSMFSAPEAEQLSNTGIVVTGIVVGDPLAGGDNTTAGEQTDIGTAGGGGDTADGGGNDTNAGADSLTGSTESGTTGGETTAGNETTGGISADTIVAPSGEAPATANKPPPSTSTRRR